MRMLSSTKPYHLCSTAHLLVVKASLLIKRISHSAVKVSGTLYASVVKCQLLVLDVAPKIHYEAKTMVLLLLDFEIIIQSDQVNQILYCLARNTTETKSNDLKEVEIRLDTKLWAECLSKRNFA